MSIPNIISFGRILLVPVFAVLYLKGNVTAAMGVLLLSGASDILDGAIARRFNMVTELGKALDPVADKLIQTAMMLCAAAKAPGIWLLLGLHVLREVTLAAMGLHVLRVTGHVYSARWYGKLCTAAIYVVMIGVLAFPALPKAMVKLGVLACTALVALCLCLYFINYLRILRAATGKIE